MAPLELLLPCLLFVAATALVLAFVALAWHVYRDVALLYLPHCPRSHALQQSADVKDGSADEKRLLQPGHKASCHVPSAQLVWCYADLDATETSWSWWGRKKVDVHHLPPVANVV